jgi:hypothetical protein
MGVALLLFLALCSFAMLPSSASVNFLKVPDVLYEGSLLTKLNALGAAASVLELIYDGSLWYEVCRSEN